jgi:beta-barrel assembly-enhancing protease
MARLGLGCCAALLVLATGCATPPPAIAPGAPFAAEADEQLLWEESEKLDQAIAESGELSDDAALTAYLERVAGRLVADDLAAAGLALRARVVRDPNRNAFVNPNGTLYVHSGLLCALDNEAQLATVMGHEIAHFTGRHGLRKKRSRESHERAARVSGAILGVTAGAGGLIGLALAGVGGLAIGTGLEASVSGYSRDMEREADRVGFDYLVRAGYDPEEGARVFGVLREELVAEDIEESYWFGSHPLLAEREESYAEMLEEQGGGGGFEGGAEYAAAVRDVLLENAELDLALGRRALARAAVERHLALDDSSAAGWYWMGELARRSREASASEDAIAHYRHALALAPDSTQTLRTLALLFREQRRDGEARPLLVRYLELDPGAVDRELIAEYLEPASDAR